MARALLAGSLLAALTWNMFPTPAARTAMTIVAATLLLAWSADTAGRGPGRSHDSRLRL